MELNTLTPVLVHAREHGFADAQVEQALAGWERVPYYFRGELAACAIVQGTEIHFAAEPGFGAKIFTRRAVREFLAPLLERHGFLTTRTDLADGDSWMFVERLGFERTWQDDDYRYFILTDLPFKRS